MALWKAETEQVAEGVWRHSGDIRRGMNVYFIADGDGVLMFDAGTKPMVEGIRQASDELGGLTRIVLGHGHTDHRGSAPRLGAEVICHPDEVEDTTGTGGFRYWDMREIPIRFSRAVYPYLHRRWDDGPVKVSETIEEGDEIAGFRVIHFPGHAPGLIALWRESDGVALVSDTIYLVDAMRLKPADDVRVPHPVWNWDTDAARDSVRKLADLGARLICPGHAEPLEGDPADLAAELRRAADAPFDPPPREIR